MNTDLMNIIFGMKVRKVRTDLGLSLTDFAKKCSLSPSYLTEIEKGRKYPKRDKIMKIANVTGASYDELVSIRLDPSLEHLESALSSPLLNEFPFEEFGLDLGNLVDLLTRAPAKVSALLHAIIEIAKRYGMKEEHFLRATLRSYQEMHDNHFEEIELAAEKAAADFGLSHPISQEQLETVVSRECNLEIDHGVLRSHPDLSDYRSVLLKRNRSRLLINDALHSGQITFQIARELGHKCLELQERAFTSPPEVVESFEQVLNDFKASYFAGALMMPREEMLADIELLFQQTTWKPEMLEGLLVKYDATPEMLCYRMSELIPEHFGVDLHFLRFQDEGKRFRLVKTLNLNQLPMPEGFDRGEHYCRRWLTVSLLQELQTAPAELHTNVQVSEFLNSRERFLCFGFARPLALKQGVGTSVTLGFRVNAELRRTIRFTDDPAIPMTVINDTCERCPLTWDQCNVRAVSPRLFDAEQAKVRREAVLRMLKAGG